MICRWEKVRDLAMKKQTELHHLIMNLQMEQISGLKKWMTGMEDTICTLDAPGESLHLVELQLVQIIEIQVKILATGQTYCKMRLDFFVMNIIITFDTHSKTYKG